MNCYRCRTKLHQKSIDAAYEKIYLNNPNASGYEIEQAVRSYLMKRKMKRVGILFLISLAGVFAGTDWFETMVENNAFLKSVSCMLLDFSPIGMLASILMFSKALHDPLTPNEAEELRRRDAVEKGGQREE